MTVCERQKAHEQQQQNETKLTKIKQRFGLSGLQEHGFQYKPLPNTN